ncbi:hypothetical protein [Paraliomyxa miuraensis]|uniref:hypothetical protein n=1 Tax=Paraliomyxa miuraensis TaxID=376150 RepID=UPI0022524B08|nr:hypothetical protein [Paraliomyxa miuraensis]MCX4243848.1 hypothetical protein [Paraliomyxa miuraensis]
MRWCGPVLLVLALGCGPSVTLESDGSGTGDGGTMTSDPDDGADTTDGIPSPPPLACEPQPSRGMDPITADTPCETYFSGPGNELREITVRIVNATADPIVVRNHLVGAAFWRFFEVTGTLGGREVSAYDEACPDFWEPTACMSFGPEPPACTLEGRPPSPSLRIEPGGWSEQPWLAWVTAGARLPGACIGDGADPQECQVAVTAGPGTYEVIADALPTDECPTACACMPDEHGACEVVEGEERPRSTLSARAAWDGLCGEVEITFGGR